MVSSSAGTAIVTSAKELRPLFHNPPRQFSTGPLWVWNDMLTEDQVRSTLRDLAKQKIQQVWVHPRPGLMTPYLGDEWFKLFRIALNEAAKLDMNVWIYDENSYPSGFAGGWVPEVMPESRGRGLSLKEVDAVPAWNNDTVAVYRLGGDAGFVNLSAHARSGEKLPSGRYMVASEVRSGNSPWHGNRSYVNLLSPGVTEKFLELTMEPYRKHFGSEFGKRIPGVFTDEPNIRPAGGLPWSEVLVGEFKKRWGYDLLDHLPSLSKPVGDWRKIRHNYYQVLHEQFVEHWAKPYFNYCETNNLQFTGHYWDHDWPDCAGVPDNMAMYAWHQLPAIDCLMNRYQESTHAQFGNVRMVKELSSVANQMGWKQTLCEIYGAGGWDLRFEDMKRIGDWLEVLGVNVLNQHLSYVTIRGARKRDHPQSFSYHAPWWEDYHVSASYFARLSTALTHGEQINPVLVLEPTTTAWMYQGDGAHLREIGDAFFKLLMALEAAQIEYDLGCEDIIARHGRVQNGKLVIGKRTYEHIVIPPLTENLNKPTQNLLERISKGYTGGTARVDGALRSGGTNNPSSWFLNATNRDNYIRARVSRIKDDLTALPLYVERNPGDRGILFHNRRVLDDGELLFLVNTSITEPSSGVVISQLGGVEQWDLYTGETKPYPFAKIPNRVTAKFDLPPSGSLLLFFTKAPMKAEFPSIVTRTHSPTGGVEIRREEPNVLTLDYMTVSARGQTRSNVYFYAANQFVWEKNGMKRNPWDSAVQFKRELIDVRFPQNSGFVATYTFVVEDSVPRDLAIVVERPDLYSIQCNGQPIRADKGNWWLDKAFGRIPIAKLARLGTNTITLTASPFTMFHELEPAYLLGDFSLKPVAAGFVITAARPLTLESQPGPLAHGANPDGTMWLSGGIGQEGAALDRQPHLVFDLGKSTALRSVKIWNYNENHVRDLTSRGARKVRLMGGATIEDCKITLAEVELARSTGAPSEAETLPVKASNVRYVRMEILSNHAGTSYPPEGAPVDSGFVGLAEVQFFAEKETEPLRNVRVAKASSELPTHNRLAVFLVDGSGLTQATPGWNVQGHPFYSAGVAYAENFEIGRKNGRYFVHMPKWYGSVARVKVNGKPAGHIDAPPWKCDVTGRIRSGRNKIEITVIGTPKNLLGPHHGGAALGAAWPGNFQQAPNSGPPPGRAYSNVGYGLFAPFTLLQEQAEPQPTGRVAAR